MPNIKNLFNTSFLPLGQSDIRHKLSSATFLEEASKLRKKSTKHLLTEKELRAFKNKGRL
jgi:hypothetical protein